MIERIESEKSGLVIARVHTFKKLCALLYFTAAAPQKHFI